MIGMARRNEGSGADIDHDTGGAALGVTALLACLVAAGASYASLACYRAPLAFHRRRRDHLAPGVRHAHVRPTKRPNVP